MFELTFQYIRVLEANYNGIRKIIVTSRVYAADEPRAVTIVVTTYTISTISRFQHFICFSGDIP